jgi:hypothetical protein
MSDSNLASEVDLEKGNTKETVSFSEESSVGEPGATFATLPTPKVELATALGGASEALPKHGGVAGRVGGPAKDTPQISVDVHINEGKDTINTMHEEIDRRRSTSPTMNQVVDYAKQQDIERHAKMNTVKFKSNDPNEDRTIKQLMVDALTRSTPATVFVLFLITLVVVMEQTGNSNVALNFFVSIFFVLEISVRLWALGRKRFVRDTFCLIDSVITLLDVVGVFMEFVLKTSGGEETEQLIAWLNYGRLLRILRTYRLLRSLADVFMRKRTPLVEARDKAIKEAHEKYTRGEYVIRDPKLAETQAAMAQMTTTLRAYHLAKTRHFNNSKWVSRKAGRKYGEANARPRRIKTFRGKYRRKLYGEKAKGELYDIKRTSMKEINEHFGLSIGLYFNTLFMCGKFFLMIFIVSSPAVAAFADLQKGTGIDAWLVGTAVCMHKQNVTFYPEMVQHVRLSCLPTSPHMVAAFVVLPMLFYFLKSYMAYVELVIKEIDDSVISAQDFAVEVMDPDDDAFDPDEWYHFFHTYGRVVAITVVLDNGQLLQSLAELHEIDHVLSQLPFPEGSLDTEEEIAEKELHQERERLRKEASHREHHLNMGFDPEAFNPLGHTHLDDDLSEWKRSIWQTIGFDRDREWWLKQRARKDLEVQALLDVKYKVAKVFCVYDTAYDQLNALNHLCSGVIPAALDLSDKCPSDMFRGTNVLNIREAPEPEDVRYHCIGTCTESQKTMQYLALTLLVFATMGFELYIVGQLQKLESSVVTAVFLTSCNIVVPQFIKACVEHFEVHEYHSTRTASLFYKMATFRIFNTAFVVYFTTTAILSEEFLLQIQSVLLTDAIILPLKNMIDLNYQAKQQIMSRFMETTKSGYQKKMDLLFSGAPVEMNDRYSNIAKTVFVSLMYYAVLPTTTLISALSFFLSFWADKYGLLRIWKQTPNQNGQVAQMMGVFILLSVLVHMMASKFFYSAWPFDNRCKSEHGEGYEKCDALAEAFYFEYKFTTPGPQRVLTEFYQWMFILTVVFGFAYAVLVKYRGFFHSLFHAETRDTYGTPDDQFSQTRSIKLYIPEVHLPFQVNPLLTCDMGEVDSRHLSWIGDYEANNLFSFAKKVVDDDFDAKTMFSRCKQYVRHEDRLAHFAIKIQRARRAKSAYRRSLQDLAELEKEKVKEKQFEFRAKQTQLDMERLEVAIARADQAQSDAQESDSVAKETYIQMLETMNQKLENVGALGDVSGKLEQLDKLKTLDQANFVELHGKLDQLSKGLEANREDKLDFISAELEKNGQVGADQYRPASPSELLHQRLSVHTDTQVSALKAELEATRAKQQEMKAELEATHAQQREMKAEMLAEIAAGREASHEHQQEILKTMLSLHENQRELLKADAAHTAANTGAAAAAVDEKQIQASQAEAVANSLPQAEGTPAAPLPAALQRKSRKEKKRKTKTKSTNKSPATMSPTTIPWETFFCTLSEGPFKGEQQELSFSQTGLRMKSARGETHVLWKAVEKWRVLDGSSFEFDTADTKYPFVCDSAERTLAIFQVFQEKGTLLIRGYRFQVTDEGDEADDNCVLRVKADGVSVNNGPWLAWSNVAQWNLEPGDEEEDGSVGMDIFEFWARDSTGEETEYAVECDEIDAVYLNAAFDHRVNESGVGKAPPTFQRQRVIV